MSEKRRLSTRNRGEPPLKKRALTPPPPPAPPRAAAAVLPPPAEPIIEGLPVRLREGQPLPTLPESQDSSLPDKAYQTVPERLVSLLPRGICLTNFLTAAYWQLPLNAHGRNGSLEASLKYTGQNLRGRRQ